MAKGVDYCISVHTSKKGFCLYTLESLMKDWPVASYLVMERNTRVNGGRPILGSSYDLLILRGVEVLNQVIPIYLVSLKFIIMFLFAPLFVLAC